MRRDLRRKDRTTQTVSAAVATAHPELPRRAGRASILTAHPGRISADAFRRGGCGVAQHLAYRRNVSPDRTCTRNGCRQPAAATLIIVYDDSTAVLGPLSRVREPYSYDVCLGHAQRFTAPRGWELTRLPIDTSVRTEQDDDLLALADVVRPLQRPRAVELTRPPGSESHPAGRARGKSHLRLLE